MKRTVLIAFLVLAACRQADVGPEELPSQEHRQELTRAVQARIRHASRVELFVLGPRPTLSPTGTTSFHGWYVRSTPTRGFNPAAITAAIVQDLHPSDGLVRPCEFRPDFGVRFVAQAHATDVLLDYGCRQAEVFLGGTEIGMGSHRLSKSDLSAGPPLLFPQLHSPGN